MSNSVSRAIGILNLLSGRERLSLSQISEALDIPKSTAFVILSTLFREGLVCRDVSMSYSLGARLIEFGERAQRQQDIRRIALPFIEELNRAFDETIHLTVLDHQKNEALYIECCESSRRLRAYSVIGRTAPLYCTSVGKALLAHLEEEDRTCILDSIRFDRFTPSTLPDKAALLDELERVRNKGYAVDDEEHEEGVRCVGVPIFDFHRCPVAALSITGPAGRMDDRALETMSRELMKAAGEISQKLGYKTGGQRGKVGRDGKKTA